MGYGNTSKLQQNDNIRNIPRIVSALEETMARLMSRGDVSLFRLTASATFNANPIQAAFIPLNLMGNCTMEQTVHG